MITKFETFTFGELDKYEKSDLENELSNYEHWYEFYKGEYEEIKEIVDDAIKEFQKKVPIFDKIHVQLVQKFNDKRKDILGMYSHESILKIPIIFLGIKGIFDALKEYDVSLETTIRSTLFHELGHAIVDVDNKFVYIKDDNILDFEEDEEEYVENFAFELEMYGRISDPNILKLANLYKTADPLDIN